jgi:hypothetical protein
MIAKLPELLGVDAQLPHPSVKRNDGKAHFVFRNRQAGSRRLPVAPNPIYR